MGRGRKIALLAAAIFAVAGLLLVIQVRKGVSAREKPSAFEEAVARMARSFAIPSSAKHARNPYRAEQSVIAKARAHFADHCALCHANNGSGQTELGRNLYPKAPDLRKPSTQQMTDGEIFYIIRNGIRLSGMPAWGDHEGDEASWKLVLFIRHLPAISSEELKEMESLNPKSAREPGEHGAGDKPPTRGRGPEEDKP